MAAPIMRHGFVHFRRIYPNLSYNINKYLSTTAVNEAKYSNRVKNTHNRNRQSPKFMDDLNDHGKWTRNDEQSFDVYNSSGSRITSTSSEVPERFNIPPHIKYTQVQGSDVNFGHVVMLAKNRKLRERKQSYLLEGATHILDAVNAGVEVTSIFFTKGELLEKFPLDMLVAGGTELYRVKMGHMQLWSDLVQASGIMGALLNASYDCPRTAVCKTPKSGEALQPIQSQLPLTLVCDNIRDPGNLGLLLRSAAAAGCQQVLLSSGCVDPWEPKVLRAAAGAHYQLSILGNIGWHILANYLHPESQIYVTDGTSHQDMPEDFDRKTKHRINNYEFQEMEEVDEQHEERVIVDSSYLDKEHLEDYTNAPLPVVDYFTPDYTKRHTMVVVSGDTQGISTPVKKLVYDRHGDALSIPITASMCGLNAAISGSLVLFEVKRQHIISNAFIDS